MSALAPELVLDAMREMTATQLAEIASLLGNAVQKDEPTLLLTVAGAARIAVVSEKTIRRKIAAGDLKGCRVGASVRIQRDELERYLASSAPASPAAVDRPRRRRIGGSGTVAAAFRQLETPGGNCPAHG